MKLKFESVNRTQLNQNAKYLNALLERAGYEVTKKTDKVTPAGKIAIVMIVQRKK